MSLWWMDPGWKKAVCSCGRNIWDSGGDPDHGVCYDCFSGQRPDTPYPLPPCDICGQYDACAGVGRYGVCSQACAEEAEKRMAITKETK